MVAWWMRIALSCIILFTCWTAAHGQHMTTGHVEVLDARHWNFSQRMPLSHTWTFIENKIVAPEAVRREKSNIIFFPSIWNVKRADGRGQGSATYALDVIVPDTVRNWALEIPQHYSSYRLWVNGQLIASAGSVGMAKEDASPQWIHQVATFKSTGDTLQIVMQLANFHHYKGGGMHPIYLGNPHIIRTHLNWSIASNVLEASVLFLEGFFFLLFYRRKKKEVVLYFALLCLTWSVRSIFSNLYPVVMVFPEIHWQWLVKIEYITLYLTIIWASLFFHSIFKNLSHVVFAYLPVVINLFFIAFTLFTPAIIFTQWISFYLAVAAIVILWGVTLIVRALIMEKDGSWFFMSSVCTGVVLFAYDISAYQSSFSYNIALLNVGYLVIFIFTTIALLYHIGIIKNKSQQKDSLTMSDLYNSDNQ